MSGQLVVLSGLDWSEINFQVEEAMKYQKRPSKQSKTTVLTTRSSQA